MSGRWLRSVCGDCPAQVLTESRINTHEINRRKLNTTDSPDCKIRPFTNNRGGLHNGAKTPHTPHLARFRTLSGPLAHHTSTFLLSIGIIDCCPMPTHSLVPFQIWAPEESFSVPCQHDLTHGSVKIMKELIPAESFEIFQSQS